jgi:hypothetical protein
MLGRVAIGIAVAILAVVYAGVTVPPAPDVCDVVLRDLQDLSRQTGDGAGAPSHCARAVEIGQALTAVKVEPHAQRSVESITG